MSLKIIYFHGFNSTGNTGTVKQLKQYFDIVAPTYDCTNANIAYNTLNKLVLENISNDIILMGTSLGGFWANYFSEKYRLPCLLVNPSINPDESLKNFIGKNKNFSNGKEYELTEANVDTYKNYKSTTTYGITKFIYLCINDDVLNYKIADNFFDGYKKIYDTVHGHRIEDIQKIVEVIEELNNTIVHSGNEPTNIIKENFKNLFKTDDKKKYVDQVWDLLQNSYASIGGIKGSGFTSKEDMMLNIPFWKLYTNKDGKVVTAVLYKDKEGRKSVVGGTDGSIEGKKYLSVIKNQDITMNRSYFEASDRMLSFIIKTTPNIKDYCIPYNTVVDIVNEPMRKVDDDDPEVLKHPELKEFFYQRKIGGHWKTKLMVGKTNNTIYGK